MNPDEIAAILKGELGKFGETLADERKKSEERAKELDSRLKNLETSGTAGAARTNYAEQLEGGAPPAMGKGENPEQFIERLRGAQGVRHVSINGANVPVLMHLPRGLAGVRDGRGLMAVRMMRAMALAVAQGKPFSHDNALDAARSHWGAHDFVLGELEGVRDLVRAVQGTDAAKKTDAQRALGTAVIGAGGALIGPQQAGPFIDYLSAVAVMRRLGAQVLPMNATSMAMPAFDTGATVAYRGENAGPNESSPGDGMLELLRKLLAGAVVLSNELLAEASYAVYVLVRNHLARQMAAHADKKMILGRGIQHELRGLDWWAEQPTTAHYGNRNLGVGSVSTFKSLMKDFTGAFSVIAGENKPITAGEGANPGIVVGNRDFWGLMRVTDAQDRRAFYDEVRGGTLLGANIACSTQIPENLAGDGAGSGTNNKSKIFVADFGSLVIAEGEVIETAAYPGGSYKDLNGTMQSGITNRETVITADQKHDFADLYRGKSIYRIDSVDLGVAF